MPVTSDSKIVETAVISLVLEGFLMFGGSHCCGFSTRQVL